MKKNNIKNMMILLFVAIIWGLAFVAQSSGASFLSPFTFNCLRSWLAAIALLVYIIIANIRKKGQKAKEDKKILIIAGVLSGLSLFIATSIQQIAIEYTTAGKAGFITSLYIIFVPILGLFLHKKAGINIWISVLVATCGFYLLCTKETFSIGIGELLLLIASIFFAVQIIIIDKYTSLVDGVKMSFIQFIIVGILSIVPMLLEKPSFSSISDAIPSILYLGLISSGLGYTLQIIGQKNVNPTTASLILSLESVFSYIFGVIILSEHVLFNEAIGCLLIFSGVVISQLNFKKIIR